MSTQRFHYPLFVATTRNKRPILSGRISAFQWVKRPYLGKVLDISEEGFVVSSCT